MSNEPTKAAPAKVTGTAKAATSAADDAADSIPERSPGDSGTDPRGAAMTAAAREAELAELKAERKDLERRLGEGADELAVERATVAALRAAVARSGRGGVTRFELSEGTRQALLQSGRATDERTGDALILEGTQVTRIDAAGGKATFDMPEAAPAAAGDDK